MAYWIKPNSWNHHCEAFLSFEAITEQDQNYGVQVTAQQQDESIHHFDVQPKL
jgi:hypothetical protein